MTSSPAIVLDSICLICKRGKLRRGKRLMVATDSFWECDFCHTEYHRKQEKFELRKVQPQYDPWNGYDGELLSEVELLRISQGGKSDAQIAKEVDRKKAEEQFMRAAEERKQQEEAERRRIEQTPGTPQNYMFRIKTVLGIPADDTDLNIKVSWGSASEARQQIKRITQMQKELRQIKKDLALQQKNLRSSFAAAKANVRPSDLTAFFSGNNSRAAGREKAAQREDLRGQQENALKPFQHLVGVIDSTLVSLDSLKIDIDKKISMTPAESAQEEAPKPKTQTVKRESKQKQVEKVSFESMLGELNSMVGLDGVKSEVVELANFLKVQQMRKSKGMPTTPVSLHVVFYGNPGTGKTSVARLLSKMYQSLGVLSGGHLVETDRAGLVAGYVGQTALKVTESVNNALGGTLFIDEAYSLTDGAETGYGSEAVETLLKLMEDHRDDLAVVIAGYPDRMERFISSNPGLRSRFNRYWRFEDYKPEQLSAIFEGFAKRAGFQLSPATSEKLLTMFQNAYAKRDQAFGNARLARNLFESSISNQASRIVTMDDPSEQSLATLEPEDIPDDWETV